MVKISRTDLDPPTKWWWCRKYEIANRPINFFIDEANELLGPCIFRQLDSLFENELFKHQCELKSLWTQTVGQLTMNDEHQSVLVLGTGTRVPESLPATRVLAGYPGSRVGHITWKIKNSNVSSARVQLQLLIAFVVMDSNGVRSLSICTYNISLIFIYLFIASFQCNDSNEDVTSLFKEVNSKSSKRSDIYNHFDTE
jgi:hypothetical protein